MYFGCCGGIDEESVCLSLFKFSFIILIPKNSKLESFNDYRPIYLCNLIYKIISKIISNMIKPYLAISMSKEQFGFLSNRLIMDAIGVAQEGLHSIKIKKLNAIILKLDMIKAYDRVDWVYLRLVLLQNNLPLKVTIG